MLGVSAGLVFLEDDRAFFTFCFRSGFVFLLFGLLNYRYTGGIS